MITTFFLRPNIGQIVLLSSIAFGKLLLPSPIIPVQVTDMSLGQIWRAIFSNVVQLAVRAPLCTAQGAQSLKLVTGILMLSLTMAVRTDTYILWHSVYQAMFYQYQRVIWGAQPYTQQFWPINLPDTRIHFSVDSACFWIQFCFWIEWDGCQDWEVWWWLM